MTQDIGRSEQHQIIANLTDGVILITPDHRISWANPAALAMHGAARLEDLGGTVTGYRDLFVLRYRNRHPVSLDRYPIERAAAGEVFEDVYVDVARAARAASPAPADPGAGETTWVHRIRSLVTTAPDGSPETLVMIVQDVTERFEAEERFERTFAANPAPAIICRLADLRYVKLNQGFSELTGYARDDLVGRTLYEVDVLAGAPDRDRAVERLKAGQTIPQMEASLRGADGAERAVIVAGQPIEIADDPCMLFTFADLEPRRKAETALRASEQRFETAFRMAPVPMLLARRDGFRLLGINEAFTAVFGYGATEALGRSPGELGLWVDGKAQGRFEREILRDGGVQNAEVCLTPRHGGELDCLVAAETVTIAGEVCVLGVIQDITARKRSERELIAAIDAVMADTSWFSRSIIEKLASLRQPGRTAPDARLDALTARERQVLGLICQGLSDALIGKRLSLAHNTVRNHVAALYHKLGVHRRSEAVIWGRERGFPAQTGLDGDEGGRPAPAQA
ncbi:HTH-type transcriptional regulator MalT [Methylobacterium crusticola]|uniref:HTH-type transcriptional regulator MalT n=1 Tax=Methylobacterium crusticola TaxID=1697972 RepID=A0ABQ4QXH2_9HYPH|nr:PAS domain S-box protein [Methylobacterium crusticola]GJD50097.1 HTH-type transcriptional regulator MalT [Methylobacterium crusticola]